MVKANIGLLFGILYQSPWSNSGWGNSSPWSNAQTHTSWSDSGNNKNVAVWGDAPTTPATSNPVPVPIPIAPVVNKFPWANSGWGDSSPWSNAQNNTAWTDSGNNRNIGILPNTGVPAVPGNFQTPVVAPPVVVVPPPIQASVAPIGGNNPFLDPFNAGWKGALPTIPSQPIYQPAPGKMLPPALGGGSGYYPTAPTPFITPKSTYQEPIQMGIGGDLIHKIGDIFGGVTKRVTNVLPTGLTNLFGGQPTTKAPIDMGNYPSMEQVTGMKPPSLFQTRPMNQDEINQYNQQIISKQEARYKDYSGLEKFVEYSRMPGELIDLYASKSTFFGSPLAGKDLINIPKSLTGWESDWKYTVPTQKQAEQAFITGRVRNINELNEISGQKSPVDVFLGGVGYGLKTAPAQVGISMLGGALLGKAIPMAGAVSRIGATRYATSLATKEGANTIGLGVARFASKNILTPATTYAEPLMNLAGAGYVGYEVKKAGTVEGGLTVGTGLFEAVKFGAAYKGFQRTYEPTLKSLKGIEGANALSKTTKPLDIVEASIAGKAKFTGESPSNMYGRPITPPSGKSLTVLDKELAGQSRWTTGIGGKGEAPSNYPKAPGRFGFTDIFGKVSGKVESVGDVRPIRTSEYGYGNKAIENPFEGFGNLGKTVVGFGKGLAQKGELPVPDFGTGLLRPYMVSELPVRNLNVHPTEFVSPRIDKFGSFVGNSEVGITSPIYSGAEIGKNIFNPFEYVGGRTGTGNGNRNQNGNPFESPIGNPVSNPVRNPFIYPGKLPNIYPEPYQNPNRNPFINPGEVTHDNPFINPNINENPFINPHDNPTDNPNSNPFINPNDNPFVNPTINQTGKGGFPPKYGFVPPLAGGPGGGGGGGGGGKGFFGHTKEHPIDYDVLGRQVQQAPRRRNAPQMMHNVELPFSGNQGKVKAPSMGKAQPQRAIMPFSGQGQAKAGRVKLQRNMMSSVGQQVVNEAFGMDKKGRKIKVDR